MKVATTCSGIALRAIASPLVRGFFIACVVGLMALRANAGSIFDDDWTPPKPMAQRTVTPAQSQPVVPNPAPPTTSQPVTAPQSSSRRAIPAKLDLARSRGLLKEAFAKQLKDRSAAGRKKLAQALIDEVPKAADNPVDQYVLLGGAIDASKEAANLQLCFQAADMIASQYEVDGFSVKIEAAMKVNLRGDSPAVAAENANAALELIDPLLAAEDFTTAARILSLLRPAVSSDAALAADIQKRIRTVDALRLAHDRAAQQLLKLKASPDDPAANLAVGSYLCFNKGDWDKGLPMLAKGSDANLKQLAELEIARPTSAEDVMRLGDRWWEFGAKQPDAIRGEIDQHAASFYKTGLESATGLKRTLLEHRIADAAEQASIAISQGAAESFTNSIGMKFVRVKAGEFVMGSPIDEAGRQPNEMPHHVKLTKPFLLGATAVTQAQWKAVMGNNPGHFQGDQRPVELISWNEAQAFCDKLSTREREHYRLPTEAEWEYACRAGTQSAFSFGDGRIDDFAWYGGNGGRQTHDVATKKPNKWGLYDMHGNVWQWCLDAFGAYGGDSVDPSGAVDVSDHALRGGSWDRDAKDCRSASRLSLAPDSRHDNVGLRVVLEIHLVPSNGKPLSATPSRNDHGPIVNSIGIKFVRIQPGEFLMGSPPTETGHEGREMLHHVKLTKSFLMATTPVTQAQWKAVMGTNPSIFHGDDLPVEMVSWDDAVSFCEKLGTKDGKHYRLPTEAEWEYACRAGTQTAYAGTGNLDEMAWYDGNANRLTHPVALKKPNAWGLYDMHGNVWQWCADRWGGDYHADSVTDPTGPMEGALRMVRGGSFGNIAVLCRSAVRLIYATDFRSFSIGFRVVLDPGK